MKNTKQGFATMDPEKQREIASKGGKTVASNKEHMSAIGSKGGKNVAKNREHMAEIGRKGGKATQTKKKTECGPDLKNTECRNDGTPVKVVLPVIDNVADMINW